MTGPHRVYTAQPELLGFQSCGVGLRDPMWTVSRAGKRAIVPASPRLGAQASTGCSQPGFQPRARPSPVVFLMLLAFILPSHRLEC